MAITKDFEYKKPNKLKNVLGLLEQFKKRAKILAGGTDLIVYLKEMLAEPELVIDIKGIGDLHKLVLKDDTIFIGAAITFAELIESKIIKENLPILWQASNTVGSVGIRNRATLVGNICSAVPSLDSAPALLVYDAHIIIQSATEKKSISIHDWFLGPKKTILQTDELVLGIEIRNPGKHAGVYEKLGRYRGEDLAQAGIVIMVNAKNPYRFACCAVGPIPKRMKKLEQFLKGKKITEDILRKAEQIIAEEISPITDIRSKAEYRTLMMQVMFKRGFKKSLKYFQGGEL